ncbi:MAG TPA: hypothetical protein VNM40_03560 [Candidatus Paceibacterota bacterium]|nr:hypothetical protein [Candidatus Paceibacterota bacterium]
MLTIGVESEGQLIGPDGKRADTVRALGSKSLKFPNKPFAEITSDAALCSIELVTGICSSAGEVLSDLNFLRSKLPQDYTIKFTTKIPVPEGMDHVPLAPKPRYSALLNAVQRESPEAWRKMYDIAGCCSTQVHVGIDPTTVAGTALLNFWNHIGPYAAVRVREIHGIAQEAAGHCALWSEFADPRRFPSQRWFTSPDEMRKYIAGIPKMLKQIGDEWVVDLETPSELGDPDSESTIWWLARPRGKYKTIEIRPFPSLEPKHSALVAGDVQKISEAFLNETHAEGFANPRELRPVFTKLSGRFYMVPPTPLSDHEWRHYFRQ